MIIYTTTYRIRTILMAVQNDSQEGLLFLMIRSNSPKEY
jgi:hypothetical protein